jgi:hypothetical protein
VYQNGGRRRRQVQVQFAELIVARLVSVEVGASVARRFRCQFSNRLPRRAFRDRLAVLLHGAELRFARGDAFI